MARKNVQTVILSATVLLAACGHQGIDSKETEEAHSPSQSENSKKAGKGCVAVREEDYLEGVQISEKHASIFWAEPNEVGLRLGISGLSRGSSFPLLPGPPHYPRKTAHIRCEFHVRNDGTVPLKLSFPGFQHRGMKAQLRDSKGEVHASEFVAYGFVVTCDRFRLAPGHAVKLTLASANKDKNPPSFHVNPGGYQLEFVCGVGQCFDGSYQEKLLPYQALSSGAKPGLGEWIGALTSAPLEIKIDPSPPK